MNDMKKCNKKACFVTVLLLYLFFFGYEFVVHGMLLKPMYMETAALWRPVAQMQSLMVFSMLRYLVMAVVLTCLFKKFRKGWSVCETGTTEAATTCCPIKSGGLCFGIKIGLLLGVWNAGAFVYLPIPSSLAVAWFLTGLFEGIGAGIILGIVCKGKSGMCETTSSCDTKTSCETK